eukprot:NODE_3_length_56144_cov_0.348184.p16 type:complete len:115 gc:universal NODE_3_length_56144_cov_0.348184:11300-11644(+)
MHQYPVLRRVFQFVNKSTHHLHTQNQLIHHVFVWLLVAMIVSHIHIPSVLGSVDKQLFLTHISMFNQMQLLAVYLVQIQQVIHYSHYGFSDDARAIHSQNHYSVLDQLKCCHQF